jgi:hypothetical protein
MAGGGLKLRAGQECVASIAMPATIAPAIVPKIIASKNGTDFRNRRRINCSSTP